MVIIGVDEQLKQVQKAIKEGRYEDAQAILPGVIADVKLIEGERNFFYARDICSRSPQGVCPRISIKRAGLEDLMKEKNEALEQENKELRVELFSKIMDLLMQAHPDYEEIPFGYCDKKGQMVYTPSVAEIFGEERVVSYSHLKAIYESAKKGVRLKNFELKPGIFIYTYPLSYVRLPVGVAFVVDDSRRELEKGKMFRFVRSVLGEVKKISENYKLLKRRVS